MGELWTWPPLVFIFQLYSLLTLLSPTNSPQYLAPCKCVYSQVWALLLVQQVTSKLSLEALGQMRKTNP